MKQALAIKLTEFFDAAEAQFPDKSTAFLLEVAAQEASKHLVKQFDSEDIAQALYQTK